MAKRNREPYEVVGVARIDEGVRPKRAHMGTFRVDCAATNISDPDRKTVIDNVLIDTGSDSTWLPSPALESIGVRRVKKRLTFIMANGAKITRSSGYVI